MSQDYDTIPAGQSLAGSVTPLQERDDTLATKFAGPAAPSTTLAFQWWADTTTGLLKLRNAANTAWIVVGTLAEVALGMIKADGSVAMAADLSLGSNKATNMATCTAGTDGANKDYVDANTGSYAKTLVTGHPNGISSNVVQFGILKNTPSGKISYSAGVFTVNENMSLDILCKLTNNPNVNNQVIVYLQIDTGSGFTTHIQDDAFDGGSFDNLILSYEYTFSSGDKFRIAESGVITTSAGLPYAGFLKVYRSS